MENKEKAFPVSDESYSDKYQIIVPCRGEEKNLIVCDVCGHANPEHTALCEMCSNYLDRS